MGNEDTEHSGGDSGGDGRPVVAAVTLPVTLCTVAQLVAVYPDTRVWYEAAQPRLMGAYGGLGVDDYWLLTLDEFNRLAGPLGLLEGEGGLDGW